MTATVRYGALTPAMLDDASQSCARLTAMLAPLGGIQQALSSIRASLVETGAWRGPGASHYEAVSQLPETAVAVLMDVLEQVSGQLNSLLAPMAADLSMPGTADQQMYDAAEQAVRSLRARPAPPRLRWHGTASPLPKGSELAGFIYNDPQQPAPPSTMLGDLPVVDPLFPHMPTPDDINQGFALGDCFFLSSLATLVARSPNWPRQHITALPDGRYSVTLYDKKGRPVHVVVDAEMPASAAATGSAVANAPLGYDTVNPHPLEALGAASTALWPALYEKAYAEVVGTPGFTASHGYRPGVGYRGEGSAGFPDDAMRALTGQPATQTYYGSQPTADLARHLAAAQSRHQLLAVSTLPSAPPGAVPNLVWNHSYFVRSYDAATGMVQLGNPWGNDEPPPLSVQQLQQYAPWLTVGTV